MTPSSLAIAQREKEQRAFRAALPIYLVGSVLLHGPTLTYALNLPWRQSVPTHSNEPLEIVIVEPEDLRVPDDVNRTEPDVEAPEIHEEPEDITNLDSPKPEPDLEIPDEPATPIPPEPELETPDWPKEPEEIAELDPQENQPELETADWPKRPEGKANLALQRSRPDLETEKDKPPSNAADNLNQSSPSPKARSQSRVTNSSLTSSTSNARQSKTGSASNNSPSGREVVARTSGSDENVSSAQGTGQRGKSSANNSGSSPGSRRIASSDQGVGQTGGGTGSGDDSNRSNSTTDSASQGTGNVACRRCGKPSYPRQLLAQGIEGQTEINLDVDKSGRVIQAQVSKPSGYPELDQAAMEAVQKWRFSPSEKGQMGVPAIVKFRLKDAQ